MLHTIKETAAIAKVTTKTLYHYHKLGLLVPCQITKAGYRLYGQKELERLQQILFYRELDFPLSDIAELLSQESDRITILSRQRELLFARIKKFEIFINTIETSIACEQRGEVLDTENLFIGFTPSEWKEALKEQSDYLKDSFDFDLTGDQPLDAPALNEAAQEAIHFQAELVRFLREGAYVQDEQVQKLLADHYAFLHKNGHADNPKMFLEQVRFLVKDPFHRQWMEGAQIGLSYYFLAAVEAFASYPGMEGA